MYRYAVAAGCDIERFELMDLNSTPTFFVNGKRHKGPWDAAPDPRAGERSSRPLARLLAGLELRCRDPGPLGGPAAFEPLDEHR